MNLWGDINWYAVQARPGGEEVARRSLESLALETFLPKARRERCVRGALRSAVRPLFPGYLFARFTPAHALHRVRYSRGVRRVLSAGLTPLPVEDDLIADIRARLGDDGCMRLQARAWQPGEAVRVQEGPLQGWSGIFERELDDRRRVVILLEAIQQARVVLEARLLESAQAA